MLIWNLIWHPGVFEKRFEKHYYCWKLKVGGLISLNYNWKWIPGFVCWDQDWNSFSIGLRSQLRSQFSILRLNCFRYVNNLHALTPRILGFAQLCLSVFSSCFRSLLFTVLTIWTSDSSLSKLLFKSFVSGIKKSVVDFVWSWIFRNRSIKWVLFKAFKVSSVYTPVILPNKNVTQDKLNKNYLDNITIKSNWLCLLIWKISRE